MNCLNAEEWFERLLEEQVDDDVLLHAAECTDCGALLAQLQEMTESLRGLKVADAPSEVVARACAILATPSRTQRLLNRLPELIRLALVLDTAELAQLPVRSLAALGTAEGTGLRYLRFEAEDCKVEFHTTRTDNGRHDVAGRLAEPQDQGPFTVLARSSSGFSYPRISDELGHFQFAELPPDRYEVRLELPGGDVVIAPITLD